MLFAVTTLQWEASARYLCPLRHHKRLSSFLNGNFRICASLWNFEKWVVPCSVINRGQAKFGFIFISTLTYFRYLAERGIHRGLVKRICMQTVTSYQKEKDS